MIALTKVQLRVLEFIRGYIQAHRFSPSYAEIAEGMGMKSKVSVARVIDVLKKKSALTKIPRRSRSIELIGPDSFTVNLAAELSDSLRQYAAKEKVSPETILAEALRAYLGAA
jgi:SOS-response transcriptional repressor LexA